MKLLTGRMAVAAAALLTLLVGAYLSISANTSEPEDRAIFGVVAWDSRYLAGAATVAGVIYVFAFRNDWVRNTWLILLTCSAWGRGLDLLVNGSGFFDREQEVKGFLIWSTFWLSGIVAAFLLSAYGWLYGPTGATARKGPT